MSKNPDEVKLWELWALSMIVDSYLETDAETGQIKLKTDKYGEFLEHCYQVTYCHVTDWHANNSVSWTTTKVELSPVAVLFAGYRAEYTNNFLDMYGHYMYSHVKDSYEVSLLVAECQVNDILTAMVLYGQKLEEKESGYTEPDRHISISSFGDSPNDLTLSLFGLTDITIYGLSKGLSDEFSNGSSDAKADGKIDVSNAMLGVICSNAVDFGVDYIDNLPIIGPIVSKGYKIYSITNDLYSTYQNVKNENELRDEYIHDIKKINYISKLYIGGTVIQCGDNVTINHVICNQNQLMVDVAFYNRDENHDSEISVDRLQAEFNSYINGGETDILDEFVNYKKFYKGNNYKSYCDLIDEKLGDIRKEKQENGEDVSPHVYIQSASPEELQEAIIRANREGDSE